MQIYITANHVRIFHTSINVEYFTRFFNIIILFFLLEY